MILVGESIQYPVFGTLLVIVGVCFLTLVNRLKIIEASDALVHQRGLLFPVWSKRYPLQHLKTIAIRKKVKQKGENTVVTFPIEINGARDGIVLNHRSPRFTREIAEELAKYVGVPLVNRIYGRSSKRSPDELDLPLVERWERRGKRFEKPALSFDTRLRENHRGTNYEILMPASHPSLRYLVYGLSVFVLLAAPGPLPEFFQSEGYRWIAAFAAIAVLMLLAFIGPSSLRFTLSHVTFRQGYFPRRSKVRPSEVEEMIVASDGITLVGDERTLWIPWAGTKKDAKFIRELVPYQLMRIGRQELSER